MIKAVTELLKQFKDRFDDGKEFYNVGVKTLEKHEIGYFSTKSDKKAAIVERLNRTLKAAMWKYFYYKGTYKWIDILDQLVYNYINEDQVWTTLYGHINAESPLPKFKVGDMVRI